MGVTWKDGKGASLIREPTKVEDTINNKKVDLSRALEGDLSRAYQTLN